MRRVVHASSSAVYGDDPATTKSENRVGRPQSPYAVTKAAQELYAGVYCRALALETVGLRYFDVYGPRQSPAGAYSSVLSRWILTCLAGQAPNIHDGQEIQRDFCHVEDVVQANLLAATTRRVEALGAAFNVGSGRATTLKELWALMAQACRQLAPGISWGEGARPESLPGHLSDLVADISQARKILGYSPDWPIDRGLAELLAWHFHRSQRWKAPRPAAPPPVALCPG